MKPSDARSSSFAILGLLSLAPMSGYDLRREARGSVGHFWSESYGQIYPTLRRLAADGLVRAHARHRGRADRKAWEITPEGRAALERWLAVAPRSRPVRNELLLKLFFGSRRSAPALARHVQGVREMLAGHLAVYTDLEERARRESRNDPSLPYWLMTLSFGRHHDRALLAWCDETLRTLRRLETPSGRKDRTRRTT